MTEEPRSGPVGGQECNYRTLFGPARSIFPCLMAVPKQTLVHSLAERRFSSRALGMEHSFRRVGDKVYDSLCQVFAEPGCGWQLTQENKATRVHWRIPNVCRGFLVHPGTIFFFFSNFRMPKGQIGGQADFAWAGRAAVLPPPPPRRRRHDRGCGGRGGVMHRAGGPGPALSVGACGGTPMPGDGNRAPLPLIFSEEAAVQNARATARARASDAPADG
eukprot:gene24270-biopygen1345